MNLFTSVFLILFILIQCQKDSLGLSLSCADVHNNLNGSLFLAHPRTAEDPGMCSSSKTCCTQQAEADFKEGAKRDARLLLQNVTSSLSLLLINNLNNFQDKFRTMILSSHNSTLSMFSKNYTKLGSSPLNPVSNLFASLLNYMGGKEIDIHASINRFFDDLFPEIYHKMIKARHREVNTNYVDCLRGAQQDINPFGNFPHQMSAQLDKSFDAAKTILKSIRLAIEIVNQTANFNISPSCARSFVKLTYCAQCQGHLYARACPGLCSNIARGCFAHLTEVDKPWVDFVSAFERLSTAIIGYFNIENVLEKLDSKISEAIKHALDNSQQLGNRVKIACGHPKRYSRQVHGALASQSSSSSSSSDASQSAGKAFLDSMQQMQPSSPISSSSSSSLYIRLQAFVYQLSESKGFFTKLADEVCLLDSVSGSSEFCWNGESLGRYKKAIAGDGIQAQKFNPEMSLHDVKHPQVVLIIDKLKQMKEILKLKIRTIPQSDSFIMTAADEGSGQGGKGGDVYYKYTDDEDYSENYSGSGDGEDDSSSPIAETTFTFIESTTGHPDKGSSANSLFTSHTLWSTMVLVMILKAIIRH